MQRLASRQLLDLLEATETVGDDQRVRRGLANRRQQNALADLHGYLVLLSFKTKRASHAATARVDDLEIQAQPLEQLLLGIEFQDRLVMAMPVHQGLTLELRR